MCLKPQPPRPIPPDTKALVGPKLDEDTVYRFVGDVLFEQFHDEDFADLYPNDGQPALSPVLLSFVTVFQNLENLPDRRAAEAVECNQKSMHALHLSLDADNEDGFGHPRARPSRSAMQRRCARLASATWPWRGCAMRAPLPPHSSSRSRSCPVWPTI